MYHVHQGHLKVITFLSGGCAVCPNRLKYCENEEYEDQVPCFNACSKLRKLSFLTINHNVIV